jgi:hypothetical protein
MKLKRQPFKVPTLDKIEKIGETINRDIQIEEKSGVCNTFKVVKPIIPEMNLIKRRMIMKKKP